MTLESTVTWHWRAEDLAARIPGPVTTRWPNGERFARAFENDAMLMELYAPGPIDAQQPHTRDEVYVIVSGSGSFERGTGVGLERVAVAPHEVLFVPAWMPHRFVNTTYDFSTWIIFVGPSRPMA